MGGRGFPPAPLAVKLLKGNPGRRPLTTKELTVPAGIPEMPEFLDEVARAEWARLEGPLAAAGILTPLDRAGLSIVCCLLSRWVAAEEMLRSEGVVIRTAKRALPRLNPHLGIATTALEQLRRYLTEFGMTPASRSRIHVEPPTPKSKVDAFREKYDG